jgi:hypothetical protein
MLENSEAALSADEHRILARTLRMRASMAKDFRDIERLVHAARRRERLAALAEARGASAS